jgi:hypothetical protein
MGSELTCGSPYCDRPGRLYVARTAAVGGGRLTTVAGERAEQLGSVYPLEMRCIDCAHHELDLLIGDLPHY